MRPLETGLHLRSWRLEHRIGRGGHGDVWLASDSRGQQAALKIRPHTDDADALRFRKEFERLRTLRLPGVIRVLGTGADQGYIYFAMELASGVRLDRYIRAGRTAGERTRRSIDAGAGIARILTSIHQLHLAHRDIKPENVMVEASAASQSVQVTLLDFGTHRFGSLRDTTGELIGTPAYMAPEQRLGMPHDHRADCYALGVLLYNAISDQDGLDHPPGRPRPSLSCIGTEVPLAVADLVGRLLRLDPAARPTAAEAEAILRAVADGIPLSPAPWPLPISHTGDPAVLLAGHGIVVGTPGTGRKRLVNEARWQWYRKGYASLAANCVPDRAYDAWRTILDELFREQDPERRRHLAGDAASILQSVWPGLPVPVDTPETQHPSPMIIADAIRSVLERSAPVAVVLWDLEQADVGSHAVLEALTTMELKDVHIWGTSTVAPKGLPEVAPPDWSPAAAKAVWSDLVPGQPLPEELPSSALDGLAGAWQAFAKTRQLPTPPQPIPQSLRRLSVLEQPFPRSVGVRMAPDLDSLIQAGHLVSVDPDAVGPETRLRFASAATRELARLQPDDPCEAHRLALFAWEEEPPIPDTIRARAFHAFRGHRVTDALMNDVIRIALGRGDPLEIRRWIELQSLVGGPITIGEGGQGFINSYAKLYVDLMLHPGRVQLDDLRMLAADASTAEHRGLAGHLKLVHDARGEDRQRIAAEGRRWARNLSKAFPALAARMLRQTALVHLGDGQFEAALTDAENALDLARRAASQPTEDEVTEQSTTDITISPPRRLSQAEVDAAITYSAALVYNGDPSPAADLAQAMANRCQRAHRPRGEASFLTNRAVALLRLGERATASDCVAEARSLHHHHQDPYVIANWATVSARLAVERGDLLAGRRLLDEAITAGQATGDQQVLAEAWTISLDAASQSADAPEAQRALSTYGVDDLWSSRDHWPAALARWRWTVGDIEGALLATTTRRAGFGHVCVEAERARLLLVNGDVAEAISTAKNALSRPGADRYDDLNTFLRLVLGAAESHHDGDYVPLVSQTRDRQWVHLYLGALHLDAIRRRRRGENVSPVLRQLEDRSADIGHALYRALARSSGW